MLSSTSNSNDRISSMSWGRIWSAAIVILLVFIAVWDAIWISKGIYPVPADNAQLWSYHRSRIKPLDESNIVLLGTSRMTAGIDQSAFASETGIYPIQLAVAGTSPLQALEHLANYESFRGTVIVELSELILDREETLNEVRLRSWIQHFEESRKAEMVEFRLRGMANNIVSRPSLGENLPDAVFRLCTNSGTEHVKQSYFDRSTPNVRSGFPQDQIDKKQKDNLRMLWNHVAKVKPSKDKFLANAAKWEVFVRRIQSRGGKVVFVKFPISGRLKREEEIAYPRIDFWDQFASNTRARTIHFEDHPGLSRFECIDGSHLAAEDTPEFTRNLVKILFGDK